MKNKEIASAVVASTFFAIPYIGLSIALAPSLIIGCTAFGASELVLSGIKKKETLKDTDKPLYLKINAAKKSSKQILAIAPQIENANTKKNLLEIHRTIDEILEVVENNPKKAKKLNNFFDYYIPILIKITDRYDEIENKKLASDEGKNFIKKADKMISDTKKAFETILSSLYQKDIIDADADMKVYEMMMKADGIVEEDLLKKGSENDEE